jgi:hypothetical protein
LIAVRNAERSGKIQKPQTPASRQDYEKEPLIEHDGVLYPLHAGQKKAWASNAREVAIIAGTRAGKTALDAHWALREIQRTGLGGIIVGPTFRLMDKLLIPTCLAAWSGMGTWSASKYCFTFNERGLAMLGVKQASVWFGYGEDPDSLESFRAGWAILDEAGQDKFSLAAKEAIDRRLAQDQGRTLYTTTPYEWNWFKLRVWDRRGDPVAGIAVFNYESRDNPIFPVEEWDRQQALMPPWRFDMMYRGLFTRPAGLIYDCVTPENVCPRFEIPKAWKRFPGVDFGNVNTAAVLIAAEREKLGVDKWGEPTGRLFLYRSYKRAGDDARTHCEAISAGEPRTLMGAGGNANTESGWRQAFRSHGVILLEPLENARDVEVQIQCVYEALKTDQLIIFEDESGVLDEMYSFSRELDENGEPTKKIKDEARYHYLAALRYVITRLRPPRGQVKGKVVSRFK